MIFASDLDQTLIYSEKFLEDVSCQVNLVEWGKHRSYMTVPSVELLRQIARSITFVPCTTRSIEQYCRIQLFQRNIVPRYAVVSNGANLIIDGVLDIGYQAEVTRMIAAECMAPGDMLREFSKIVSAEWASPMRQADGVIHYCIINRRKVPLGVVQAFARWAERNRWVVTVQERKLYLIPYPVNKWAALQRIIKLTDDDRVIAAGDSLLDLSLLMGAGCALVPSHGELYLQYDGQKAGWDFTKARGINAGEELLRSVLTKTTTAESGG